MKILGRHLLAEMSECNSPILNDISQLEKIMMEAARLAGATVVKSVFHRYNPQGLSGIVVIAESHISIHTWPEYRYAAVDCFTCGQNINPNRIIDHLIEALGCSSIQLSDLNRGMPSDRDEFIAHKSESIGSAAIGR